MPLRQAIEKFGRCCECLLSSAALENPLSEEETQFIRYYVGELERKFDGLAYRPNDAGSS
jgi:hypothetical protein